METKTMTSPFIPIRLTTIRKLRNAKCWQGCGYMDSSWPVGRRTERQSSSGGEKLALNQVEEAHAQSSSSATLGSVFQSRAHTAL